MSRLDVCITPWGDAALNQNDPNRKSARKRKPTGQHTGRPLDGRVVQLPLDRDELFTLMQNSLDSSAGLTSPNPAWVDSPVLRHC